MDTRRSNPGSDSAARGPTTSSSRTQAPGQKSGRLLFTGNTGFIPPDIDTSVQEHPELDSSKLRMSASTGQPVIETLSTLLRKVLDSSKVPSPTLGKLPNVFSLDSMLVPVPELNSALAQASKAIVPDPMDGRTVVDLTAILPVLRKVLAASASGSTVVSAEVLRTVIVQNFSCLGVTTVSAGPFLVYIGFGNITIPGRTWLDRTDNLCLANGDGIVLSNGDPISAFGCNDILSLTWGVANANFNGLTEVGGSNTLIDSAGNILSLSDGSALGIEGSLPVFSVAYYGGTTIPGSTSINTPLLSALIKFAATTIAGSTSINTPTFRMDYRFSTTTIPGSSTLNTPNFPVAVKFLSTVINCTTALNTPNFPVTILVNSFSVTGSTVLNTPNPTQINGLILSNGDGIVLSNGDGIVASY